MKCPKCETDMQTRDGKFGEFYFCPNQYKCKQKTLTKYKRPKSRETESDSGYAEWERKRMFKVLDCSDYDIYGNKINKDDNGYGEPCDDSGFWENEGEWFRPY